MTKKPFAILTYLSASLILIVLMFFLAPNGSKLDPLSIKDGVYKYGHWVKEQDAYFNYSSGYDIAVYKRAREKGLGIGVSRIDQSCINISTEALIVSLYFNGVMIDFEHRCIAKKVAALTPLTNADESKLLNEFIYNHTVKMKSNYGAEVTFKTSGIKSVIEILNSKSAIYARN